MQGDHQLEVAKHVHQARIERIAAAAKRAAEAPDDAESQDARKVRLLRRLAASIFR